MYVCTWDNIYCTIWVGHVLHTVELAWFPLLYFCCYHFPWDLNYCNIYSNDLTAFLSHTVSLYIALTCLLQSASYPCSLCPRAFSFLPVTPASVSTFSLLLLVFWPLLFSLMATYLISTFLCSQKNYFVIHV